MWREGGVDDIGKWGWLVIVARGEVEKMNEFENLVDLFVNVLLRRVCMNFYFSVFWLLFFVYLK